MSELYATALVGYRAWVLHGAGQLCSTMSLLPWRGSVERAECRLEDVEEHEAPARKCSCGLYAFHYLEQAELWAASMCFTGGGAAGLIAGRGRAEVHASGFRVAEAQIVALLRPDYRLGLRRRTQLERAAERYGVPLVGRERLHELAARVGSPAPMALRPLDGEGGEGP